MKVEVKSIGRSDVAEKAEREQIAALIALRKAKVIFDDEFSKSLGKLSAYTIIDAWGDEPLITEFIQKNREAIYRKVKPIYDQADEDVKGRVLLMFIDWNEKRIALLCLEFIKEFLNKEIFEKVLLFFGKDYGGGIVESIEKGTDFFQECQLEFLGSVFEKIADVAKNILLHSLQSAMPNVRKHAAKSLGNYTQHADVRFRLFELVRSDENIHVRHMAFKSLQKNNVDRSMIIDGYLLLGLADKNYHMSYHLGEYLHYANYSILEEALVHSSSIVRDIAGFHLYTREDIYKNTQKKSLENLQLLVLEKALSDPSWKVRYPVALFSAQKGFLVQKVFDVLFELAYDKIVDIGSYIPQYRGKALEVLKKIPLDADQMEVLLPKICGTIWEDTKDVTPKALEFLEKKLLEGEGVYAALKHAVAKSRFNSTRSKAAVLLSQSEKGVAILKEIAKISQ